MGRIKKYKHVRRNNAMRATESKIRTAGAETVIVVEDSPAVVYATGRRIITIGSWLDTVNVGIQHGRTCPNAKMVFDKEVRTGLRSRLLMTCCSCSEFSEWVCNDKDEDEVTLPINESLIWGTNAGGSYFEAVKGVLTVMDIPFPSHTLFSKQEDLVINKWEDILFQEIIKNGEAEAKATKVVGNTVSVNGVLYPSTGVYVDGGWSTRSYGHSCKSKGGVAVIIGELTNKLLHIGIKNMFCVICKRSSNMSTPAPTHACYKNWDETVSATNMESSIILDGFRASIETHGLVYNVLIADGDSSVYSTLLNSQIYPGAYIQKAECVNHVIKNLNKALIKVCSDTSIPLSQRKLLTKLQVSRVGKSVRSAIIHRHKNNPTEHQLLRKDIMNIPFHTFGQHEKCDSYFCTKTDEENFVPLLQETILWKRLLDAVNKVAFLSSRLILNKTSNIAESFMNRVAKHNIGKRINVVQRRGWHAKVTTAALSFSMGKAFYYKTYKSLTGCNPSRLWKQSNEVVQRKLDRVRTHDPIRKKNRYNSKITRKPVSDHHYGPGAACPDIDDEALFTLISNLRMKLQVTEAERDEIFNLTLDQSELGRWMEERRPRVTASFAGDIHVRKDSTSNEVLVRRMLYAKSLRHLNQIKHGKTYEIAGLQAYSRTTGNQWLPSGLFVSLENGVLAASPDGLVGTDGLVEVKCPESLIGFPPEHMPEIMKDSSYLKRRSPDDPTLELSKSHKHYKQIVMQLHVTGRLWCDFVVYSYRVNSRKQEDYVPFVQRIYRNEETLKLWNEMRVKLDKFHEQDLAPEIVNPREDRGMPIRQPKYRQDAMEKVRQTRSQVAPPTETISNYLSTIELVVKNIGGE